MSGRDKMPLAITIVLFIAAGLWVVVWATGHRWEQPPTQPTQAVLVLREVVEVRTIIEITATPPPTAHPEPAATRAMLAEPTAAPTFVNTPYVRDQIQIGYVITRADGTQLVYIGGGQWAYPTPKPGVPRQQPYDSYPPVVVPEPTLCGGQLCP